MKTSCIVVALVAFVAFVKADSATQSTYDKIVADALVNIEAGSKKFEEVFGIKTDFDKKKVHDFLTNGLGENKKKIEDTLKNLEESAKPLNDEVKKTVEALSKQFNDSVKELAADKQGNVKKLQESFEKAFKDVLDKANNAVKSSGVDKKVKDDLSKLITEIGNGAKIVQNKLQEVISEAQKKSA